MPAHLCGGHRPLPQRNTSSLLCLDEASGMGLYCQGTAAVQETSNLLPGSSRPGFCSTQRSWTSPACYPCEVPHPGHWALHMAKHRWVLEVKHPPCSPFTAQALCDHRTTCWLTWRLRSLMAHPDQIGAGHVFHPSQGGDNNFAIKGTILQ